MRESQHVRSRLTAITILGMMIVPALAAAVPAVSSPKPISTYGEQIGDWWEDTSMDRDGDYIHDEFGLLQVTITTNISMMMLGFQ